MNRIEQITKNINRNIYDNGVSYSQLKSIFSNKNRVEFNKVIFNKICFKTSFQTKYFSSRFIVFLALYHDEFQIPIVDILNKKQNIDLSQEAIDMLDKYSKFTYFRQDQQDYIKLPQNIYEELAKSYMTTGEVNYDYTYEGEDTDILKLLEFLKKSNRYIIYEILQSHCITEYYYSLAKLDFTRPPNEKIYKIQEEDSD